MSRPSWRFAGTEAQASIETLDDEMTHSLTLPTQPLASHTSTVEQGLADVNDGATARVTNGTP
jgi:hypothetical protein